MNTPVKEQRKILRILQGKCLELRTSGLFDGIYKYGEFDFSEMGNRIWQKDVIIKVRQNASCTVRFIHDSCSSYRTYTNIEKAMSSLESNSKYTWEDVSNNSKEKVV